MTTEDRRRLLKTLAGVYGFYDRELTEFSIRVWEEALQGIALTDIERAFRSHLSDTTRGQFLPKPADILRALKGDDQDRALIAWGRVLAQAKAGGGFSVEHCDATRQAVQALGGWPAICQADESQNGFLQKRFTDLFATYQRQETAPLLGNDTNVRRLPQ